MLVHAHYAHEYVQVQTPKTHASTHRSTRARARARTHAQVGDTTAAAFRAVLHFVYSNEPLLEPHMLIDQMRCACRVAG